MGHLAIRKDLLKVVKNLVDRSSDGTMRVLIELHNGYSLSVIAGRGAYAYGLDSYEIAAWKDDGDMDGDLIGSDDSILADQSYDQIMGHLNNLSQLS